MTLKKCTCGSVEVLGCVYFHFEGNMPLEPRIVGNCRNCLIEGNAYCELRDEKGDEHGPVVITNDPSFHGIPTKHRIARDKIGFCMECLKQELEGLKQERYDDCANLLLALGRSAEGTKKDLQVLSDRGTRFMAGDLNWAESLVLGCVFTNYICPSSIEQIALEYAFGETPRRTHERVIDTNLRM